MKVFGQEAPANFKPLTVGELRKWLDVMVARVPEAEGWWIHSLNMEEPDTDPKSHVGAYATHVESDCFDSDTGDDDSTIAYPCISLLHWPSREEKKP